MRANNPAERVLISAPVGQDAAAMAELLEGRGCSTRICRRPAECAQLIAEGAGVLLLTEETLELPEVSILLEALQQQPPWSELPLILLTSGGETRAARLLNLTAAAAGGVLLLERPMSAATLWRSVEVALRSRRRQYQVRDLIEMKGKLASIVQFSDDAIISKDLNGVITSWNRGAERLFGFTAQEAIGRPITIVIPPERLEEEPKILARMRRGETMEHFETVRRRKDGTHLDISLTVSPLRNEQGHIVGVSKIARDITERKRVEAERRKFVSLADQSAEFIGICGLDLIPFYINPSGLKMVGLDDLEAARRAKVQDFFFPEDQKLILQKFLPAVLKTGRGEIEIRFRNFKTGAPVWMIYTVTSVRDADGAIAGYATVSRNITERKLADEALHQVQAELREHAANLEKIVANRTAELRAINEQLEAFVYSIAHDLRAPLRTMLAFPELLITEHSAGLNENGRDLLERIQRAAQFMDRLLVDLLAYGRAARSEMELGPVSVQKAWKNAMFQCAGEIEQSDAQIKTVTPLPVVQAHEAMLGQCLANLLSNAIKFVPADTKPRVSFRAEERGESVRLWVEDNGIGIPEEQHERVFQVFERLHGSRYPGTGIGLSIVRKGIERMGGKTGLQSAPGTGTCFWIELPRAR